MERAPSSAPPVVRKTFLVDRGFQLKYAGALAGVGGGISLVFGAMMIVSQAEALRPLRAALPPEAGALLVHLQATQLWLTAATALLMAVALGLFGVLLTHRVAGPVYVMSRYVAVLARGRYPSMRPLRRGDELKAFFDRFREAVDALRERDAGEARQLDEALTGLAAVATTEQSRAAVELLRSLKDHKRDITERARADTNPSMPAASGV
ncbi:MAG TPA: signal protein [Myxococcaceae bacterium]|nr:signal protein [Myxococcaceae bacterium]